MSTSAAATMAVWSQVANAVGESLEQVCAMQERERQQLLQVRQARAYRLTYRILSLFNYLFISYLVHCYRCFTGAGTGGGC